jgi:hypothetical protein
MAEVLTEHQRQNASSCLCGWAKLGHSHPEHQEAMLAAAGFGLVKEAGFGPVKEAVWIHVHHDAEAHARSYNDGYEAAVTHGLADDPTLADDWFQGKLREAKAQALEEAVEAFPLETITAPDNAVVWLMERAGTMRGTSPAAGTTTEWGVRRDADSAVHSLDYALQTIKTQRKRGLKPSLIKRQVGPWELAQEP